MGLWHGFGKMKPQICFSLPVVCLCDTPGVVRRPSPVVCVVSSNLTTADMKEII